MLTIFICAGGPVTENLTLNRFERAVALPIAGSTPAGAGPGCVRFQWRNKAE